MTHDFNRAKFESAVNLLRNEDLIEASTKVKSGRYVCPLCYKVIYIEEDSRLTTCPNCGYNYLHKYPAYQK